MTSSCILGSFRLEEVKNPNFFVPHPICLKFGMVGNHEMLFTNRKPESELENNLSKENVIFYRF